MSQNYCKQVPYQLPVFFSFKILHKNICTEKFEELLVENGASLLHGQFTLITYIGSKVLSSVTSVSTGKLCRKSSFQLENYED